MMAKKVIVRKAVIRFLRLQFRGSRGEWLGIGRLSMRPSAAMRKTLPDRSEDACLDTDEVDAIILMLQAIKGARN